MICHGSSLFLIENKNVRIWLPRKLWTGRSAGISCGSVRPVCILFREKSSQVSLINIKEELNSECFLNFSTRSSLIRHLRQPLHHDPAAFSRAILGGKCAQAGVEQDRFGLVENTVPFNIRKFRKFKPGFLVKWNAPFVTLLYVWIYENGVKELAP